MVGAPAYLRAEREQASDHAKIGAMTRGGLSGVTEYRR